MVDNFAGNQISVGYVLGEPITQGEENRLVLAALRTYESLCVESCTDQALNSNERKRYLDETFKIQTLIDLYTRKAAIDTFLATECSKVIDGDDETGEGNG